MRLVEIELWNYRAFRSASLRIGADGPVLIAGANNAGKTALLAALDAIAGTETDLSAVRHLASNAPAQVSATFSLSREERELLWAASEKAELLVAAGVGERVQFVLNEVPGPLMRVALVRASWPPGGLEPIGGTFGEHGGDLSFMVVSALRPPEGHRDARELVQSRRDARHEAERVLEDRWRGSELEPLRLMLAGWRSRFYHFRALRQGTDRTQPLSSAGQLDPSGNNLASVLLDLLTNRRTLFTHLQGLISQMVPGIGLLQVRTSNAMQVVFETAAIDVNLKDLGTGVEQLLMTLTVGLAADPPYTLLVEEPETNLHPAAQRALLTFFQDWSAGGRQIIAATHSPVMLDWSPGGERLWLVTRDGGESAVEPVGEDPLALLHSLGVRPSDVLSADRLLIMEGPSDQDILEAWFPEVLRNPRVAVSAGPGGDGAVHAGRLAQWLASADRTGMQRVLYIRDRDELAPAVLGQLSAPSVFVLERRELENYLLDPPAIATVLAALRPGANGPSATEVDRAIAAAAETMRRRIIISRVCRSVRPDEPFMTHRLRQKLAEEGADAEQIIASVSGRLLSADDVRSQVTAAWADAEADVNGRKGADLLAIAPGEDVLEAVFMKFAGCHYRKRDHGPAIARASQPPGEIKDKLSEFLAD